MSRVTQRPDRGFTLADRLAHPTPMTPLEVATVGHQVATHLDALHRGGQQHRALEPAAVAVETTPDGRWLARVRPPVDGGPAVDRYRAPEQVAGRPVGPAADVYALGVVLLDGLLARPDAPPHVPADLGSAWRYLLQGMIAASAADRPTADTVARALGQVPGVVPASAPAGPDPVTVPPAAGVPRSKLLPGGAQARPAPVEVPQAGRLTRLLPPVPGRRRRPPEPDVRPRP